MEIDFTAFSLIANSLAKRFLSMYYVEIEGGVFKEFIHSDYFAAIGAKKEGKDFFFMALKDARKFLHPDDLQNFIKNHDKETILKNLEKNDVYSLSCRLIINGKIVNVRFTDIMCDDKKHILSGVENIDDEIKAKMEHERNLLSAEKDGLDAIIASSEGSGRIFPMLIRTDTAQVAFSVAVSSGVNSLPDALKKLRVKYLQ